MISNIRGSKEVEIKYFIQDTNGYVLEDISDKEFARDFNNSLELLQDYASEQYNGIVVENK